MPSPQRLTFTLLLLLLAQPGITADGAWKGESLRAYIQALTQQGLRVIYSDDLVLKEYRVAEEPTAADPAAALRAALLPYRLTLIDGPAGSLLITRLGDDPSPGTGAATVAVTAGGSAVGNARITIDGYPAGRTDSSGLAHVPELAAGRHWLAAWGEGYIRSPRIRLTVNKDTTVFVPVELLADEPRLAEVIVTASRYNLAYQDPHLHAFLDRDSITTLPNLGDEAVRAIARLPGTAGGGISSRHHVRGGEPNEVLFLLDGVRLYEPYHLKDFQSFVTIIHENAIAGIDFYSGGYPARFGDRMSGVIDMSLREATGETETELGISFFNTSLLSIGNFADQDRGDWLLSLRRGNLDYVLDVADPDFGGPKYQDLLAHVGWEWSVRTRVAANFLASHDKISMFDTDSGGFATANYDNRVVWLGVDTDWNESLSSRTIVSSTDIDNGREGLADMPGIVSGNVVDSSSFEAFGLKQDWQYDLSSQWVLRAGADYKSLEARYRYESFVVTQPPFEGILDNEPLVARSLELDPRGSQYAAYVEARWQPVRALTLDAGLRWDEQTYTLASHDAQFSPRFGVLYRTPKKTEVRIGWGQYYQAQEINELQIRDGLVEFYPAQRAKHLVASISHAFPSGLDFRAEFYRKAFRSLRPRYENLFDPIVLIPELQPDRVRIDADSASSRGAEFTLSKGDPGDPYRWWASYTWAEVKDGFSDGSVERSWDQTHTLKAGFNWLLGPWNLSAAATAHSGWPKTELIADYATNAGGTDELILSVTPRNSLRYSTFHSLDARISRDFDVGRGQLTGFLEITNLYSRNNPCCLEYRLSTDENGLQRIHVRQRNWLPLVPSLGLVWRF